MTYEVYTMGAAAAGILILMPCAVSDVRSHSISVRLVAAALAGGLGFSLWKVLTETATPSDVFLSVMPGIFLLVTAGLSRERIGSGDGAVFVVIGLLIGCRDAFIVLYLALMASAVYCGTLLLRRKADRSTAIAWMPFVLTGYLMWTVGMLWSGGFAG